MTRSEIPAGLAEHLAQTALASVDGHPPVDLHAVAASLGVSSISFDSDLVGDGFVEWDHTGRPAVTLAANGPLSRQRFTLAHELGHVLLEGPPGERRHRRPQLDPSAEETLCDRIAAGLLMPRPWVDRYAHRDRLNLSILRLVAQRAEVSLSAVAVRLGQVGARTSALLRWRRTESGRWILLGCAGVPRHLGVAVSMPPKTARTVERLGFRDTWLDIELDFGGQLQRVNAHGSRSGDRCILFITHLKPADPMGS